MDSVQFQYWFMKNEDISYGKKPKLIDYFYDSYNLYNASKSQLMATGILDEKTVDRFLEGKKKFDLEKG